MGYKFGQGWCSKVNRSSTGTAARANHVVWWTNAPGGSSFSFAAFVGMAILQAARATNIPSVECEAKLHSLQPPKKKSGVNSIPSFSLSDKSDSPGWMHLELAGINWIPSFSLSDQRGELTWSKRRLAT